MTKIKRYGFFQNLCEGIGEQTNGEWIKFSDHEKAMYQQSELQRIHDNKEFKEWRVVAKQKLKDRLFKNKYYYSEEGKKLSNDVIDEVFGK